MVQQQGALAVEEPKKDAKRKIKVETPHPNESATAQPVVAQVQAAPVPPVVVTGAIEKAKPAPLPEPRNAQERIIRDRMRVAQFLNLPVQMIALIEDKSRKGPPEVMVKKSGLLFLAVRQNGGKAPGYKTEFLREKDDDPEHPDFVSKTTLMPTPDPTTWIDGYGTANSRTLAKHMLQFAREMCETRSRVRALQAFTGCGFSVALPEEMTGPEGPREVTVESVVEETPSAKPVDESFYADDAPPPQNASKAALSDLERLLARAGKAGLDVLDAALRRQMVDGAAALEPQALQELIDELKAMTGMVEASK